MTNKSLTETLKRFDEGIAKDIHDAERVQIWDAGEHGGVDLEEELVGRTRQFIVDSIKDALEAVRVDKGEHICEDGEPPEGEICGERFYTDTWNANTTQYDENMRKYLEE